MGETTDPSRSALVVDDDTAVAEVLGAQLRQAGFSCAVVHSGAAALEALEARPFSVVLSDLRMPGMDGLALMREVRFDSAFMFAYSERDVTFAAKKLVDDVGPEVKARRLREIVALQETISAEVFAAHVGRREQVLVHGPSRRDPAQMVGRTDGFKSVILPAGVGAIGELVEVTIQRATMATLFA